MGRRIIALAPIIRRVPPRAIALRSGGFAFLAELIRVGATLGHLREFQDEVDDLVLIYGCAELIQSLRRLLIIFDHLLLLARKAAGLGDDRAGQIIIRNLDIVGAADFRQQQAQLHAPLGDVAVLGLELLLALAL